MKIDNALMEKVLGLKHPEQISCDTMGPLFMDSKRMLGFLDDEKFIPQLKTHPTLEALFATKDLAGKLAGLRVKKIICDDPRYCFAILYNHCAQQRYQKRPSIIDSSARVHPRAYVADCNVAISAGVVVEPNATILPDVDIGENCYIHAGAVLGADGYESKRTGRGLISVFHDGKLILEPNVRIGANASLDKGIFGRHTIIGRNTTIGPLTYIAHSTQIGEDCTITGTAVICGSCTVGDSTTIGPNATISHILMIGNSAFVHLGSVVTRHVGANESVSGNFAIPHQKFMTNLKKSLA